MAADLIDEYRLLTFPTILGTGERLFPPGRPPAYLEVLSAEHSGAAVLTHYGRARQPAGLVRNSLYPERPVVTAHPDPGSAAQT